MGWVDPWVGRVGNGSRIVFGGLGWVVGLKWQICEKPMCLDCRLRIEKVESVELIHWGCMQGQSDDCAAVVLQLSLFALIRVHFDDYGDYR